MNTLSDSLDLVGLCIGDFDRELLEGNVSGVREQDDTTYLLNGHHDLNGVKAVETEVFCKVCGGGKLCGVSLRVLEQHSKVR